MTYKRRPNHKHQLGSNELRGNEDDLSFTLTDGEEIIIDIALKKCIESYHIDEPFTGQVILSFNHGGLASCEKVEKIKKVVKLK